MWNVSRLKQRLLHIRRSLNDGTVNSNIMNNDNTIGCATRLPYHRIKPNCNQVELSTSLSSTQHHLQVGDIQPSILYIDSNYCGEGNSMLYP